MFNPDFDKIQENILSKYPLSPASASEKPYIQTILSATKLSREMLEEYHKQLMAYLAEK